MDLDRGCPEWRAVLRAVVVVVVVVVAVVVMVVVDALAGRAEL